MTPSAPALSWDLERLGIPVIQVARHFKQEVLRSEKAVNNLEKSEEVIARIVAHLMEMGIQHSSVSAESFGIDSELLPFFAPCFEWLVREGIVSSGQRLSTLDGDLRVINPSLTAYGFACLNRPVRLGEDEKTLGKIVKEAAKPGYFTQAGDFIGGILGGFTKSVSS